QTLVLLLRPGFFPGAGLVVAFRLGRLRFLACRGGRFSLRRRLYFHLLIPGRGAAFALQPFDRVVNFAQLLLPPVEILGLLAADERDHLRRVRVDFGAREGIADAVEDAVKRVVIALRDRVELVIVTARATHAQAQKSLSEVVNRVVDRQVHLLVARTEAAR